MHPEAQIQSVHLEKRMWDNTPLGGGLDCALKGLVYITHFI